MPKIKRHLKGSQANCTPAIDGRHVVACFGSEGLYCYDFAGNLLWSRDLAFVSSGNRPIQPILAVRAGATGDISLKGGQEANAGVAWSRLRGGPYMPTPILYGEYLYTCSNSGVVACYEAATGKEVYKERVGGSSYTASPVAADGRLYFTSEAGEVRVVKAGPAFELLAVNELGDYCLATPAVSNGALFVRSQHYLWALGTR